MDYVNWEVFIWIIGIIITVGGIIVKYIMNSISDIKTIIDNNRKEAKELDARIDIIEAYHTQTQISIAKINKDIEYIRLSVDKLLNKNKIN
jgi:predicted PurR-regulated permease PerM